MALYIQTVKDQSVRAEQAGIRVSLSEQLDRLGADRPSTAGCPTCDSGILTITHPRRCRECTKGGL